MEEEPPKKLDGVQRHRPVAVSMGIVFPAKRHPPVLECQQAAIGDRHAMGIAREILQDRPRAADGGFGIHDPLGGPEGAQELLPPRGVSEGRALPLSRQGPCCIGLMEPGQEQTTEHPTQHTDREEERGPTGDPLRPIGGQPTPRDDAVEVGMVTTTVTIP